MMRVILIVLTSLLVLPAGAQPLPGEHRANSSRLEPTTDNKEESMVIRLETEVNTTISIPSITSRQCEARVSLGYYQSNTNASVEGEIEHENCPQSVGTFDVQVSYRTDDGQSERLTFTESWQRGNGESLSFTRDYPIGKGVTLTRVRSRNVRCACNEALQNTVEPGREE